MRRSLPRDLLVLETSLSHSASWLPSSALFAASSRTAPFESSLLRRKTSYNRAKDTRQGSRRPQHQDRHASSLVLDVADVRSRDSVETADPTNANFFGTQIGLQLRGAPPRRRLRCLRSNRRHLNTVRRRHRSALFLSASHLLTWALLRVQAAPPTSKGATSSQCHHPGPFLLYPYPFDIMQLVKRLTAAMRHYFPPRSPHGRLSDHELAALLLDPRTKSCSYIIKDEVNVMHATGRSRPILQHLIDERAQLIPFSLLTDLFLAPQPAVEDAQKVAVRPAGQSAGPPLTKKHKLEDDLVKDVDEGLAVLNIFSSFTPDQCLVILQHLKVVCSTIH